MALYPTGPSTSGGKHGPAEYHLKQCCPEDQVIFDYDSPIDLLCEISLPSDAYTKEHDSFSVEESLMLLDKSQCPSQVRCSSISSVPSPLSDCSWDSGVTRSSNCADEPFLSGLFGADFPLDQLSDDPQSPSPCDQSSMTLRKTSKSLLSDVNKTNTKLEMPERNRKNAEAARQNRIKKKKYVENLEKDRSALKVENVILKAKCHEFQTKCQRLQFEVAYLHSVLANESALASLIQNIPNVPNVKLATSFRKRLGPDPTSQPSDKRQRLSETSGGICLHVAKDCLSLEFCSQCGKQASDQY